MPRELVEHAPAKVNLTLRVTGRRADGYHTLESLVVFAGVQDRLAFVPGGAASLAVRGPNASGAGAVADNLVLRAARTLAAEIDGLKLGGFALTKHLPAAAGVGGGSADAAAALRLLARANRLKLTDPRLLRAAARIGADVPVCVDPRPRVMRGIGEILSKPLRIPRFAAVLVNPGIAVPTKDVFAHLHRSGRKPQPAAQARSVPRGRAAFLAYLKRRANDLEPAAVEIAPAIAKVLAALQKTPGCELARMSGSGATCFGLYASARAAAAAARSISRQHRRWWVCATHLG
ncbi:MAG: 4-(cytidine 5'-diphospho)-2-C-methyl-D-erythritol kinase [Xanthobacteraceae bacterium]